mgnify:CR=1 FL=1
MQLDAGAQCDARTSWPQHSLRRPKSEERGQEFKAEPRRAAQRVRVRLTARRSTPARSAIWGRTYRGVQREGVGPERSMHDSAAGEVKRNRAKRCSQTYRAAKCSHFRGLTWS